MMLLFEWIASILLCLGSLFALCAAIGLVRFPTTLSRAHAVGVASTLAILLVMVGVCFGIAEYGATGKGLLTIVFIFLTAPVGSHVLAGAVVKRSSRAQEEDE